MSQSPSFNPEIQDVRIFRAILFGLAAAIVAAALWYGVAMVTHLKLGYLAIGAGGLVGAAVV